MRWIIGDIHGMLKPLRALLEVVLREDPAAQILFAGDYVNRGPDTRSVIDLLLSLRDAGTARFIRGNHDEVIDLILHGRSFDAHPAGPDPVSAFLWFSRYGLNDTLMSYGVDSADIEYVVHRPSPEGVRRLMGAMPEAHRRFLHDLPAVIEEPDIFVAHAMWDPDEPDESPGIAERLAGNSQYRHKILWGRYTPAEINRKKRWRRTGYFGHTPVEAIRGTHSPFGNVPIRNDKIVLLDTGAALSSAGRLSAVCAETGKLIQVDRGGVRVPGDGDGA